MVNLWQVSIYPKAKCTWDHRSLWASVITYLGHQPTVQCFQAAIGLNLTIGHWRSSAVIYKLKIWHCFHCLLFYINCNCNVLYLHRNRGKYLGGSRGEKVFLLFSSPPQQFLQNMSRRTFIWKKSSINIFRTDEPLQCNYKPFKIFVACLHMESINISSSSYLHLISLQLFNPFRCVQQHMDIKYLTYIWKK